VRLDDSTGEMDWGRAVDEEDVEATLTSLRLVAVAGVQTLLGW
jgi:hypothetical protein